MNIRGMVIVLLACLASACGGPSVAPERTRIDASTRLRSLLDASDEGRLDRISSATFSAQTKVTRAVVNENPQLYYEIQSLNPNSGEALERLATALQQLRSALASGDTASFAALMQLGRGQLGAA